MAGMLYCIGVSMKNLQLMRLILILLLTCVSHLSWAGSFNFGAGYGFVAAAENESFEGGWDVIAGYEVKSSETWNTGVQFHYVKGWTENNSDFIDTRMYFQSTALYATARPENGWLQFSAGLVSAEYKSLTATGNGMGLAAGVGAVVGGENLRLHLLDYHRYMIGGMGFNVYSISLGVIY